MKKILFSMGVIPLLVTSVSQASTFSISMNFDGVNDSQKHYFYDAAKYWESIITGYSNNVTQNEISGLTINARIKAIDGTGGTLGSSAPTSLWDDGQDTAYALAKTGRMTFDSADIDLMIKNGTFINVVEHEMAHSIGFGSLWELNGAYELGTGQYTGQYGLTSYQAEFNQPSATFIPVETEGKEGEVDYHWAEVLNGAAKTGITNSDGLDMSHELMTAWLNAPIYVSNTTIQSFRDIGYTVATVPISGSIWLFMSALVPVFLRKWKVLSDIGIRT